MMEYRVVWKRVGMSRHKIKRFAHLKLALRKIALLGPEPWKAYRTPAGPDDLHCCSGHECGCGGFTNRQWEEEYRKGFPPIEFIRIESRPVGNWSAFSPDAKNQ